MIKRVIHCALILMKKIIFDLVFFLITAQEIEQFFDGNGVEIYSGYVDDPRNTDNACLYNFIYFFNVD